MIHLPPSATAPLGLLAAEARSAGGRAWLVGGAVRDALLGRRPRDLDVAVEGRHGSVSALVLALRGKGWTRGAEHDRFGTATLFAPEGVRFDLAEARSETYPVPGALPVVTPGVAIEEDLGRRDFSIHAMAVGLGDDGPGSPFLDPRSGVADLGARTIRLLHGGSLADDPTRAFRAARYAARLGFALAPGFDEAILAAAERGSFERISGDRLRRALSELLEDENRAEAFAIVARLGVTPLVVEGWRPRDEALARLARATSPEESWEAVLSGVPSEVRGRIADRLVLPRALRRAAGCPA